MCGKQRQLEKQGRKNIRAAEGIAEECHVYLELHPQEQSPTFLIDELKLLISETHL